MVRLAGAWLKAGRQSRDWRMAVQEIPWLEDTRRLSNMTPDISILPIPMIRL